MFLCIVSLWQCETGRHIGSMSLCLLDHTGQLRYLLRHSALIGIAAQVAVTLEKRQANHPELGMASLSGLPNRHQRGGHESNVNLPVLETDALPIELPPLSIIAGRSRFLNMNRADARI